MRRGFIIVEQYIIKGFVMTLKPFLLKEANRKYFQKVFLLYDHLLLGIQTTQACWSETIIKLNIKGPVKYLLAVQNWFVGISTKALSKQEMTKVCWDAHFF